VKDEKENFEKLEAHLRAGDYFVNARRGDSIEVNVIETEAGRLIILQSDSPIHLLHVCEATKEAT
jgi:hypothetical protein